jgi:hypothetical protein
MTRGAALLIVLMVIAPAGARASMHEVVIEANQLRPRVLQTTTAQKVSFVNRSGQTVHVEFQGRPDQHHVFQVADAIWARFHGAGPHLYVVHFPGGSGRDLRGVIEVGHVPEREGDPRTCTGVTVMGVCLEP